MKKEPKIIIIGAGPCGLGAGWKLHELGYDDFIIYEKNDYAGGLAASFVDSKGFTWDIGGHVIHSHYEYFDSVIDAVLKDDYLTHEREAWMYVFDRFVPYPVQYNVHHFPKKVLDVCIQDFQVLKKQKRFAQTRDFRQWLIHRFGKTLAKQCLIPLNTKTWAYPLEKMSSDWVGDRVALLDITRILHNIKEKSDDVSWGPNNTFRFPAYGGTGEIWRRAAKHFDNHIQYKTEVVSIDHDARVIEFSDGNKDHYDLLLTTMPLDELVKKVQSNTIRKPSHDELHFSSVHIVGIGIQGSVPEQMGTKCWMYFPDPNIPFFRATVFSNYAAKNAPKGMWSLMTEIAISSYTDELDTHIAEKVVDACMDTALIPRSASIENTWQYSSEYGYPTPTLHRDAYVDATLKQLEIHGIYSRGRFGAWKYEVSNQDHTFMQGVEWVDHILSKVPEVTLFDPDQVNSK